MIKNYQTRYLYIRIYICNLYYTYIRLWVIHFKDNKNIKQADLYNMTLEIIDKQLSFNLKLK